MRRVVFEDPLTKAKVTVDLDEDVFQTIRSRFGKDRLRLYIGQLGIQAIQRAVHPDMFGQEKDDGVHVEGE